VGSISIIMKPLLNVLAWVVLGLAIGGVVYVALLQPAAPVQAPPSNNQSPPPQNQTPPPANLTANKSKVDIVMIEAPDCDACNAGGMLLTEAQTVVLQSNNLDVGNTETIPYSNPRAAQLISTYGITELPALIVSGPTGDDTEFVSAWTGGIGTVESDGSLVTRLRYPPFFDLTNKTVVGIVDAIGIRAAGCIDCGEPALFISSLEGPQIGMAFDNTTVYEENDSEAQRLIAKYNITKLPTLFLEEKEASAYPVFEQIKELGTVEDGWFILRDVVPPYVDLEANHTLRGLVNAYFIMNSSCADCLNVSSLSDYISQNTGLVVANRTEFEASSPEGMALIAKYNITMIPTLVYSDEAQYYPGFRDSWESQNNTVESDGWYVFRALPMVGAPYQNISG
jgi:hypothetical protein